MKHVRTLRMIAVVLLMFGIGANCAPQAQAQPSPGERQGWLEEDRLEWYGGTQGSRLIPEDWLLALEQPDRDAPFLDDEHISRLRYLPRRNAQGQRILPVGFAVDEQDDRRLGRTQLRWRRGQNVAAPWVGLNCSACHTAEIAYRGVVTRIDGGQSLADFQQFMESLLISLKRTRDEAARWQRFSRSVLGDTPSAAEDLPLLRNALGQYISWLENHQRMNDSGGIRYGFGRLDAFGHIYNQVADIANPGGGVAGNTPNAPVSYPFIWNIRRLTHVQYNAIAPNRQISGSIGGGSGVDAGALARNTGEVIGVFADVVVPPTPGVLGLVSSVNVNNLIGLEQRLARLQPPRWPAHFPAINEPMAAKGARLFAQQCAGCHLPTTETSVPRRLSTFRDESNPANGANADPWRDGPRNARPGTDIWMACNAYTYAAPTGRLGGMSPTYVGLPGGPRMAAQEPLSTILTALVAGTLLNRGDDVARAVVQSFFGDLRVRVFASPPLPPLVGARDDPRLETERRCIGRIAEIDLLLGYKARPLDGIWATGPFLHNGSVPNLFELLRPPAERSWSFPIGTRVFDPELVGFSIRPEEAGNDGRRFETRETENGPIIRGNSNEGHDYGNVNLTDEERFELIEYIKTL